MSIQALLMKAVTDSANGMAVVTLPPNLDGRGEKVVVPKGVDLQLFSCINLDIEHKGGGVLCMYGCDVDRLITGKDTHIDLLDCRFNEEVVLTGTTGYIEGTDIEKQEPGEGSLFRLRNWPLKILGSSDVELKLVNFSVPMRQVMEAHDSKVTLQECRTLSELHECFKIYGCSFKISRSQFYSTYRCLQIQDSSFLIVSSSLTGFKDMCLACINCSGRAVDCHPSWKPDGFIPGAQDGNEALTKGLRGAGAVVRLTGGSSAKFRDTSLMGPPKGLHGKLHDWGIKADLGSTAEFVSTNRQHTIGGGDYPAIECNGRGSSVTVIGYGSFISQNRACISCSDQGRVSITGGEYIFSGDDEGILIGTGGIVEVYQVQRIQGKTWGAVLSGGGKLTVEGPTEQIEGMGDDAILAKEGSSVILEDVTLVDGNTNGIIVEDGAELTILDVPKIQGLGGAAISMTGGGKLNLRMSSGVYIDTGESFIEGQTHGLVLSDGARALIFGYDRIEGKSEDGINARNDAHVTIRDTVLVQGKKDGIYLWGGSRLDIRRVDGIIGTSQHGVYGTSACSARFQDFGLAQGPKGAVHLLNGSDYLEMSQVGELISEDGDALWFTGRDVLIDGVTLIQTTAGQANGVVIEGADGKIQNITEIDAYYHGMIIRNDSASNRRSNIEAVKLQKCSGLTGPHGVDIVISSLKATQCSFMLDGLAANATAEFHNCTFSGAFVSSDSTLKFSSCFVNGHFKINNVSYDISDSLFDGSHQATNSSGVSRNYVQSAYYTSDNEGSVHTNGSILGVVLLSGKCTFSLEKGSLASAVDVTGSSTVKLSSAIVGGQVTLSGSTLDADSVEFGSGVDGAQSTLELDTCTVGGSVTAAAGALQLRAVVAGGVEINGGSALVATAGSLGTVTVAGSSAEIFGSNCTVAGLNHPSIPCSPGYTVRVGTGKQFEAHDDDVAHFFGKNLRIRTNKDYEINAGKEGGSMAVRVKNELNLYAGKHELTNSPLILDDYVSTPAPPEEPPT